jgi:hypothetical protein
MIDEFNKPQVDLNNEIKKGNNMQRRTLTDDTGRWFNMESAERWEDNREPDTWVGKTLYRTIGGRWILSKWSSYSGVKTQFEEVSNETAAKFLTVNGHDPHNACVKEYAALEIR